MDSVREERSIGTSGIFVRPNGRRREATSAGLRLNASKPESVPDAGAEPAERARRGRCQHPTRDTPFVTSPEAAAGRRRPRSHVPRRAPRSPVDDSNRNVVLCAAERPSKSRSAEVKPPFPRSSPAAHRGRSRRLSPRRPPALGADAPRERAALATGGGARRAAPLAAPPTATGPPVGGRTGGGAAGGAGECEPKARPPAAPLLVRSPTGGPVAGRGAAGGR